MTRLFVRTAIALMLVACSGPDRARVDLDTLAPHASNLACTYEVWTVSNQRGGFRYLVVDIDPHRKTNIPAKDEKAFDAFIVFEKAVPSYGATITGPLRDLGLHQFHSLTSGKDFAADIVEHYDAFDSATNRFHYFCGSPT